MEFGLRHLPYRANYSVDLLLQVCVAKGRETLNAGNSLQFCKTFIKYVVEKFPESAEKCGIIFGSFIQNDIISTQHVTEA